MSGRPLADPKRRKLPVSIELDLVYFLENYVPGQEDENDYLNRLGDWAVEVLSKVRQTKPQWLEVLD